MINKNVLPKEWKLKEWGPGEWVDEPDSVDFEYGDMKCHVLRNKLGSLCGYVEIPQYHPLHGYDESLYPDLEAHGGITFFEKLENGNYCIGFDCSHSTDITPETEKALKESRKGLKKRFPEMKKMFEGSMLFNPTYKNINFAIEECKSLVDQLNKYEVKNV